MTSMFFRVMTALFVSLMLSASASAEFDETIAVDVTTKEALGCGLLVTDLYAAGNVSVGDKLLSVGNADIKATHDWYQDPNGDSNGGAPNNVLVGLPGFECLKYDKYVTFNRRTDIDDSTSVDPDFDKAGNQIVGGWFWVPGNGQGKATDIGDVTGTAGQVGVLIARLTLDVGANRGGVPAGYSGTLRLFTSSEDGGDPDGVLADVVFPLEQLGACCDGNTGNCQEGVLNDDCVGDQLEWSQNAPCDNVPCFEHTGGCCDGNTGTCVDDVLRADCQGDQQEWFKNTPCGQFECTEHAGACCHAPTATCVDGVFQSQCPIDPTDPNNQFSWSKGLTCIDATGEPICLEHTGACCDGASGICVDDAFDQDCQGGQRSWFKGTPCGDVNCFEHTGACCDGNRGICQDGVLDHQCVGDQREWFKDAPCGEIDCVEHSGACCDGSAGTCVDGVFDQNCQGNRLSWFKNTPCDAIDNCGCDSETIGGAIYTDCDAPLTSGEEDVEVTVSGPNGVFSAITSGPSGTWHIPNVPCGDYTVAPRQVFRKYCHVDIGGDCPPEPCETSSHITVDADHRAENLSIQFLGQPACITNDLNYDEVCTIVFDADLFVQCVYDGECVGPDGQDLLCPADCSCDGLATIVFDANCFVHDVYMKGVCGECPDDGPADASRRLEGRRGSGFTIGGAVYDDATNPLMSGIEGVNIQVFGAGRRVVATATSAGPSGIWRVDDLPASTYTVVFEHRDGRAIAGRDVIPIVVNEENEAANLSIRLLRSVEPSRRTRDRTK